LGKPSAQDANALVGMAEAASHENRSFAVTRPAEWHIFVLDFRVSMVENDMAGSRGKHQNWHQRLGSCLGRDGDGDDHLQSILAGISGACAKSETVYGVIGHLGKLC